MRVKSFRHTPIKKSFSFGCTCIEAEWRSVWHNSRIELGVHMVQIWGYLIKILGLWNENKFFSYVSNFWKEFYFIFFWSGSAKRNCHKFWNIIQWFKHVWCNFSKMVFNFFFFSWRENYFFMKKMKYSFLFEEKKFYFWYFMMDFVHLFFENFHFWCKNY